MHNKVYKMQNLSTCSNQEYINAHMFYKIHISLPVLSFSVSEIGFQLAMVSASSAATTAKPTASNTLRRSPLLKYLSKHNSPGSMPRGILPPTLQEIFSYSGKNKNRAISN